MSGVVVIDSDMVVRGPVGPQLLGQAEVADVLGIHHEAVPVLRGAGLLDVADMRPWPRYAAPQVHALAARRGEWEHLVPRPRHGVWLGDPDDLLTEEEFAARVGIEPGGLDALILGRRVETYAVPTPVAAFEIRIHPDQVAAYLSASGAAA